MNNPVDAAIEATHDLGEIRSIHKSSDRLSVQTLFGMAASASLIALAIYLAATRSRPERGDFDAQAILLVFLAARLAVLFEYGFSYDEGGAVKTFRWEDIGMARLIEGGKRRELILTTRRAELVVFTDHDLSNYRGLYKSIAVAIYDSQREPSSPVLC